MSATAIPGIDEQVTLMDLYEAVDWDRIAESEGKWLRQAAEKAGEFDPSEDFRVKFRCVLLEEALYGKDAVQKDAQLWLHRAGVWPEVVAFLKQHGLTG